MKEFDGKSEVSTAKDQNMVAFRRAFERIDRENIVKENIDKIAILKRHFEKRNSLESPELSTEEAVIALADIDDEKGCKLAEELKPEQDELMGYLENDNTSVLARLVGRDYLQAFLDIVDEEAASEFRSLNKSELQAVAVTDKVVIYKVSDYIF